MRWLVAVALVPLALRAQSDFDDCLSATPQTVQQQAARGEPAGQYCLGFFYATGRGGLGQNVPEGVRHFRAAADRGYAPAEAFMGYFYKHGQGVPQDYGEAAKWYRKAADHGNAGAQNDLALLYLEGKGVPQDRNEALRWLHLAAKNGSAQALNVLATLERGGPQAPRAEPGAQQLEEGKRLYAAGNKAAALKSFLAAAQSGNSWAQLQVGYQYENGEGVPVNMTEAARWYAKSAQSGNAAAQCNLGHLYEDGTGVPEDWIQAARWYRASADQNNKRCQGDMGRAFQFGIGVPQNRALAVEWDQRAGAGADGNAQAAYFGKWLSSPLNNVGFRNQQEHDLVIGGRLRFGLLGGDPSGITFRNSGERTHWLLGQRRTLDVSEARTMWGIAKNQYDDCQRIHGENCQNPGPKP